jgi:hypothetical protein
LPAAVSALRLSEAPSLVDADGRDDGDEARAHQLDDDVGGDVPHLADTADVDRLARPRRDGRELVGEDEAVVLARQAHRAAAVAADERHDVLVDGAREHHLDDAHGGVVGHPQAVDEARRDVGLLEHRANLRPAAVHDHDVDPDVLQ